MKYKVLKGQIELIRDTYKDVTDREPKTLCLGRTLFLTLWDVPEEDAEEDLGVTYDQLLLSGPSVIKKAFGLKLKMDEKHDQTLKVT